LSAEATICTSAKIVATKSKQPTKGDAIFRINEQLEKRHPLLGGYAVEIAFMIVGFAGYPARHELVVNTVTDCASLRQDQKIFWSPTVICDLLGDKACDPIRFLT
jgi:hypothetical protein